MKGGSKRGCALACRACSGGMIIGCSAHDADQLDLMNQDSETYLLSFESQPNDKFPR